MTSRRRVAVTGIGVVSPVGIGQEAFWQGLLAPQPQSRERAVPGFDPAPYFDNPKEARRADRFTQLAIAAADEAIAQAGDLHADPSRIGVWIGTDGPPGAPTATADQIAPVYWDLHTHHDDAERVFTV